MQMHLTLVSNNLVGLKEKTTVLQIQHLSPESILYNIHQSQFICQLLKNSCLKYPQIKIVHLVSKS